MCMKGREEIMRVQVRLRFRHYQASIPNVDRQTASLVDCFVSLRVYL